MASDLFQSAAAWLAEKQRGADSVAVVYRRDTETVEIDATPGRPDFENFGEDETDLTTKTKDWIVTAADLRISGETILPAVGDEILYQPPGDAPAEVYSVIPLEGDRPYRHSDPHKIILRIHTIQTQ